MNPNPVEKRIRKELRLNAPLEKGEKVLVIGQLCSHLLKTITSLPIRTVVRKEGFFGIRQMDESIFKNKKLKEFVKKNKVDKIILPWTMDDEILYFLGCVFSDKKPVFLGHHGKFVKLLISVDRKDAMYYAKIRGIKYSISKKGDVEAFLEQMSKKYPETKYSLLRTTEEFSKLMKK